MHRDPSCPLCDKIRHRHLPYPGQMWLVYMRWLGHPTGTLRLGNTPPENMETQIASQPDESKVKRARRSVGLPFVKFPTQPQAPLPEATHTIELIIIHLKQLKEKYEEEKGRKEAYEVEWRRAEADLKDAREEVQKLAEDLVARQFVDRERCELAKKLEHAEREIGRLREVLQASGQRLIDLAAGPATDNDSQ
ncbi:hypothetical protein H0H92_005998 [Tricholoma furcatifolium]|nr:hypothetical protein H0H92_005998 [Tricholoma furcatifolium]